MDDFEWQVMIAVYSIYSVHLVIITVSGIFRSLQEIYKTESVRKEGCIRGAGFSSPDMTPQLVNSIGEISVADKTCILWYNVYVIWAARMYRR